MDYRLDSPKPLLDFLSYHETIKAHSQRTVDEYYLDMRNFFRYMKQIRDPALRDKPLDAIDIRDIDLPFLRSITLTDIYGYMTYLSRERVQHQHSENSNKGLNAASRARKLATIRSFFNYICNKRHLLEDNPCKDVDTPKQMKALPRYLTLNESISLLDAVDGPNRERDYCILTLFLNCGLRISELIGLDITDMQDDALRVLGCCRTLNSRIRSKITTLSLIAYPIIVRIAAMKVWSTSKLNGRIPENNEKNPMTIIAV